LPPSTTDTPSGQAPSSEAPGRNETHLEKLDRNTIELLNELRVAGTGIQVLLAFLLVAPFNQRFKSLTAFERGDYFVTLVCIAAAAALLIAPSVHHRIMFRQGEKSYLVELGSKLALVASGFLAVGLTGIIVLITHMVFGSAPSIAAGVVAGAALVGVWFALPLRQLRR
jgi:Family of unknown function (DUF6328)